MVLTLQLTAGIVTLEANVEDSQPMAAFNQDTVTVDEIVARISETDNEVAAIEMQN